MKRMTSVFTAVTLMFVFGTSLFAADCCNGTSCCNGQKCCKAHKAKK